MNHKGEANMIANQIQTNRFIDLSEATHITSLKKTKLYELIKTGELNPIKLGRKTVFLESEIVAWVTSKVVARTRGLK